MSSVIDVKCGIFALYFSSNTLTMDNDNNKSKKEFVFNILLEAGYVLAFFLFVYTLYFSFSS